MRRQHKQQSGGILPSGYTQLTYIESSGGQYIDLGVAPSSKTSVEMDVQLTSVSQGATKMLFGCNNYYGGYTRYYMLVLTTAPKLQVNCGAASGVDTLDIPIATPTTDRTTASLITDGATFTATAFGVSATYNFSGSLPSNTIYLFARRVANNAQNLIAMKMYGCTATIGEVSYNLVPALRNSDSKPGLYDIINNVFYTNAGSGEFIYG